MGEGVSKPRRVRHVELFGCTPSAMEKSRSIPWAIEDPGTRREVARRVRAGERVTAIAAAYRISASSVRRYAAEFSGELEAAR